MALLIHLNNLFFNLLDTGLSIFRIPFFAKPWGKIKRSERKKDLVIISNGPSLNAALELFFEKHTQYDSLAVNMFAISQFYKLLKPNWYVIASPDMWMDSGDSRLKNKKHRLWNAISENTDWPLSIFLPAEARSMCDLKEYVKKNSHIRICYFNRTPIEGFAFFRNICFRWNLGMPRPHNVLIPSIMVGINLGYKRQYLLGVDHSWLPEVTVNSKNEVLVNQKHFYDEDTAQPLPMSKQGGNRKLHEVLHKWYVSFKSYFIIQEYATDRGVTIYNATPNSFIDAFERKALDDL